MKKMLPAALLALAATAMSAASSFGWGAFGLIPHSWLGCCGCGCCCDKCSVCVRPYNAFTPVVSGCICCDGCMPFCGGGPGGGGMGCGPMGCGPGCDGMLPDGPGCDGCLPDAAPAAAPAKPATSAAFAMPQTNLQTAAFRPTFPSLPAYPNYGYGLPGYSQQGPAQGAQPAPMSVPSYWSK